MPDAPVPFAPHPSGAYLHGTKAALAPGDVLLPGREANVGPRRVSGYVYVSKTLDAAAWGAELAQGHGAPRIYIVEPTGPLEDDPNLTDKRFPGNPTQSYRSHEPVTVVRELTGWTGHTPQQIQAMRDGLAALEARGEAIVDD